jgi:hypothetical protein
VPAGRAPIRCSGGGAALTARARQADPQAVAEPLAGPRVLDAIREHYSAAGPEAGRPSMSAADLRALRQARRRAAHLPRSTCTQAATCLSRPVSPV